MAQKTTVLPPAKKVVLIKDSLVKFPDLFLSVYIAAPISEEMMYAGMLAKVGCKKANTPEEADLVLFGGGADVDPQLYGESNFHSETRINVERDNSDLTLYMKCLEQGIPMFGVCRGAQFLHVMNGGKLYQHVDNHHGEHSMYCRITNERIQPISSVHHQMCRPNKVGGMDVIATSNNSNNRWVNNDKKSHEPYHQDIEAYFYRETCCFGVQGHPEYGGYPQYTAWVLKMIDHLIVSNPDLKYVGKVMRIEPDILALRKEEAKAAIEAQTHSVIIN